MPSVMKSCFGDIRSSFASCDMTKLYKKFIPLQLQLYRLFFVKIPPFTAAEKSVH